MNKIIMTTVGLAIAIIATAGVLMPVLSDATETHDTYKNDGVFNMGIFSPDDEYTLTYTSTDGKLTVNSVDVPMIDVGNTLYSIVSADNCLARYGKSGGNYTLQFIGKDSNGTIFVDGGVSATVTISSGLLDVTYTKADTTVVNKKVSFTEMYAVVPTPDQAVMKFSSKPVYINGDSELYSSGLTNVANWYNMFHFEGTYDDGITITSPNIEATYDNITWNIEPVTDHKDLYKLTSVEFDIHYNDTVVHATYSYFGVPSEVTAERSVHLDLSQIALVSAIPIIVIVAILLLAVTIIARSRE